MQSAVRFCYCQCILDEEYEFSDEMEWYNPTRAQQRKIYWRLLTDFGDQDLRTDQYRWLLERSRRSTAS